MSAGFNPADDELYPKPDLQDFAECPCCQGTKELRWTHKFGQVAK